MESPAATLHLAGKRGIYGGASYRLGLRLGRWIDDAELTAGTNVLHSLEANFGPGDVGAQVYAIDPDLPEGENVLAGIVPVGTTIESVTDEGTAVLTDGIGEATGAVLRIFARDVTGHTFAAAIKEDATDSSAIETFDPLITNPEAGDLELKLTVAQTLNLASVIGSPRPATARGVWALIETTPGTPDQVDPILAGSVAVELPVLG